MTEKLVVTHRLSRTVGAWMGYSDLMDGSRSPISISVFHSYIIGFTPSLRFPILVVSHTSPIRIENKWLIFRNR